MSLEEFYAIPSGSHIYNNGADQCVALANEYNSGVLGFPLPSGIQSAYQWWTDFSSKPPLVENYSQVASNPQRGDIFIGMYGPYDSTHGHIGVVERSWDGSTFGTMENGYWNGVSSMERFNRGMAYILGFLRPKNSIPVIDSEDDEMKFKLYRQASTGVVYAASVATGTFWPLPNPDYLALMRSRGFVVDEDYVDLPDNEWGFLLGLMDNSRNQLNQVSVDPAVIAEAIKAGMSGFGLNVDAIAHAIADKLNNGGQPDVTTKAEILTAIEANYPGDK